MISSTEESDQIDIQSKQKSPSTVNTAKHPFSLAISFEKNLLTLQWDFRTVPAHQSSSTRHLLLINSLGMEMFMEPITIIKQYLKMLPLGDFIKVVDLDEWRKSAWLERTSCEVEVEMTASASLEVVLEKQLKNSPQYSERFVVVLFLGECQWLKEDSLEVFSRILECCRYEGDLALFSLMECYSEHHHSLDRLPLDIAHYQFHDRDSLLRSMKQIMVAHASVRARKLEIIVRCLTNEMELKKQPRMKWKQEDSSTIVRRYASLTNNCLYREDVMVEAALNRLLQFEIKMKAQMCDWSILYVHEHFKATISDRPLSELAEVSKNIKPPTKPGPFLTEQVDFLRSRPTNVMAQVTMRFPIAENRELYQD